MVLYGITSRRWVKWPPIHGNFVPSATKYLHLKPDNIRVLQTSRNGLTFSEISRSIRAEILRIFTVELICHSEEMHPNA